MFASIQLAVVAEGTEAERTYWACQAYVLSRCQTQQPQLCQCTHRLPRNPVTGVRSTATRLAGLEHGPCLNVWHIKIDVARALQLHLALCMLQSCHAQQSWLCSAQASDMLYTALQSTPGGLAGLDHGPCLQARQVELT